MAEKPSSGAGEPESAADEGAAAAAGPASPSRMDPALLQCRFYENQYPNNDDLVVVNVKSIAEMGAYVTLLEYNNIEGMIMLSELSRRRIRSINKLIRVGKNEVVMVIRVDQEKGYIDLSKRRVALEDIAAAEERFTKSKTVHSILRHVAEKLRIPLEKLYEQIAWPLAKKFGHAYDAFKAAVADPALVLSKLDDVEPALWEATLKNIKRRLTPQPIKVRADIQLTCFQGDGIEAIKEALIAGSTVGTKEMPISIKLIAPPLYVMLTSSLSKDVGIGMLEKAIAAVKATIESKGGTFAVKAAPRVSSQRDESELTKMLEQLEMEKKEVDGDNSGSDGE